MGFFSLLLGYLLGSIPSGWLAGRWLKATPYASAYQRNWEA